jgi:hypothetical protein
MPRTIVIAWNEYKINRGYNVPHAAVWLNEGTSADLRKARDYATKHGQRVFVFPITEPFPLRTARALV